MSKTKQALSDRRKLLKRTGFILLLLASAFVVFVLALVLDL